MPKGCAFCAPTPFCATKRPISKQKSRAKWNMFLLRTHESRCVEIETFCSLVAAGRRPRLLRFPIQNQKRSRFARAKKKAERGEKKDEIRRRKGDIGEPNDNSRGQRDKSRKTKTESRKTRAEGRKRKTTAEIRKTKSDRRN